MLFESKKPQLQDDEDMMFLKSLHPYFKDMDNLKKLQVRNEIQTVLIKELSTSKQQHQNGQVPTIPTHELYIHQHINTRCPQIYQIIQLSSVTNSTKHFLKTKSF